MNAVRSVVVLLLSAVAAAEYSRETSECYDHQNNPKKCLSDFENPAFGLNVEATNTCGEEGPTQYCVQTGASQTHACDYCQDGDHPSAYLTDLQTPGNTTWWQSETMADGVQFPASVNLTLHLNKAYDITYVRILFHSPRPETFAIFKRTKKDGDWVPFQFYSSDCRNMWGLEDRAYALESDETAPLCTSAYSDISPLSGGSIAFATLEGRKSAYDFDHNTALHDWVTATGIKIMLWRMNTFGDEHYGAENVFRSYFYAISEIAIGARCKCNGHANICDQLSLPDGSIGRRCRCMHHTAGDDCEKCADFYQDSKWKRATANDPGVCQPCNCNGFSTRCIFDEELWEKTGHGGRCIDCADNRDGPNCERCRDNYYFNEENNCLPCHCNEIGSRSLQCGRGGKCECKPGVTGDKCDACAADYYDFSTSGCKACNCLVSGSSNNQPSCDQSLGKCECKQNVEGKECSSCKPGYFNLDEENVFGCTPCFCYGHSKVCTSESGYTKSFIESMFARNSEKWGAGERGAIPNAKDVHYNVHGQEITISATGRDPVFFSAPDKFLGDQRASYNQELQFKLKVVKQTDRPSPHDVIIEGNNLAVTQTIFGNGNPLPSTQDQVYKFTLHEHPDFGWFPRLAPQAFMSILSNLTAIKIRGTYAPKGVGSLDSVKLGTAIHGGTGKPANWIERCSCPVGYISQFCESCAPGYRHEPPGGGPFSVCIPCNCNNHADSCDPDSGKCICQHNTGGNNCERCARGYYGNALAGTPTDCTPCPCPNQGSCYQLHDNSVICLECPKGYAGARCDQCSDGFYGQIDPSSPGSQMCTPCDCNGNVDVNAVNNCNRTTGECLKCIYDTAGFHCDQCLPGFFGDPLALEKGDCKPCECDPNGTEGGEDGGPFLCNQLTGQCQCKPNVTGAKCDQCKAGYFNIGSKKGCQPCNCNVTGSTGPNCDEHGQCSCRTGVTGLQCDECEKNQFGFSATGCQPCDCDTFGSSDLQCNATGYCPCLENVEGRHCDRCKENKYDRKSNCKDCPPCYNLVKDEVDQLRSNLRKLDAVLQKIITSPTSLNDKNYQSKVEEVKARVEELWLDAKRNAGDDDALTSNLKVLQTTLQELNTSLDTITQEADKAALVVEEAGKNATEIDNKIQAMRKDIMDAKRYIDSEGNFALQRAREHSLKTGQENEQMSTIAHRARTIVEKQIKEAEDTQLAAEKAVETCDEAYKLSLLVKAKQSNASQDLQNLEGQITQVQNDVDNMNVLANETLGKVNAAYQDVSSFAVEITNLQDPKVDAANLIAKADSLRAEADRLRQESVEIDENHLKEEDEVGKSLLKSGEKLGEAEILQQELDKLMAQADAAKSRAEEAVKMGEKTLKDAEYTLEILQHSDVQIQTGKKNAMDAIERIPQIRVLLREAKEKTFNAQEALAGAENNALKASQTALRAQNETAAKASQLAKEIHERAKIANADASTLKDEVESLGLHILDTNTSLQEKSERVDRFINFTKEAKEKVAAARSKANEVTKEVDEATATLKKILKDLDDLNDIDDDRLNSLERRLTELQRTFDNSNFDAQVNILNNARIQQDQHIKGYEEEVEKLKKEVEKVKAIHDALPNGCYNRPNLEQL